MNEVVAVVEGETEQAFVTKQLAAHLGFRGITIWAVLPGRNRRQGGVKEWTVARQDIIRTLREGRYCTTMFDYYAMPQSWPGRTAAMGLPWNKRAAKIQSEMLADITSSMGGGFHPEQFLPYVQLHEFEALAFADVAGLAAVVAPLASCDVEPLRAEFEAIVTAAGSPEAIDDGYATCPSRRITARVPAYKKRAFGPTITARIGLDCLRIACPNFGDWLSRLENLGGAR